MGISASAANALAALAAENAALKKSPSDVLKLRGLQEEIQAALASAGLPADYQAVPILNFRNIATEQEGDKSLKLLDDICQRVASRSSSLLSADELAKFQEFRTTAINNNRSALAINRTMMASISK